MNKLIVIMQVFVALGIFNVWLVRYGRETRWRGGSAKNMKEEFAAYGLPTWFMIVIGIAKVSIAALLIVGVWVPALTKISATALAILMLGAVSMHVKVKDPLRKALPALGILLLSTLVALLS